MCNLIVLVNFCSSEEGDIDLEKHHKVTGRCCSEADFCPGDWQGDGHMKSKSFPMISAFSGSRVGIGHQVRL